MVGLSNEKEIHERVRTKFITAVADLGGLYAVTIAIFSAFYWFFAEPYRDLNLAVSFNRMKNQICLQEGLIPQQQQFDQQFEKSLGLGFNFYLMLSKRLSIFLFKDCFSTNASQKDSNHLVTYR